MTCFFRIRCLQAYKFCIPSDLGEEVGDPLIPAEIGEHIRISDNLQATSRCGLAMSCYNYARTHHRKQPCWTCPRDQHEQQPNRESCNARVYQIQTLSPPASLIREEDRVECFDSLVRISLVDAFAGKRFALEGFNDLFRFIRRFLLRNRKPKGDV